MTLLFLTQTHTDHTHYILGFEIGFVFFCFCFQPLLLLCAAAAAAVRICFFFFNTMDGFMEKEKVFLSFYLLFHRLFHHHLSSYNVETQFFKDLICLQLLPLFFFLYYPFCCCCCFIFILYCRFLWPSSSSSASLFDDYHIETSFF